MWRRPVPEPVPGQLLIKTEAIGVNFVDTYFRTGLYPHPLPFILGSEVAGTVAAVGEGVQTAQVGDRVATSDADGAYAEILLGASRFGMPCAIAAQAPPASRDDHRHHRRPVPAAGRVPKPTAIWRPQDHGSTV